jgi:four helix bundle protein
MKINRLDNVGLKIGDCRLQIERVMDKEQFKERTQSFALRVINLVEALPKDQTTSQVIGKQLLRSGTSVGANYRAACRAKSTAELITKLNITLEEADESLYWMELIVKAKLVDSKLLQNLMQEANEIVSMLVSSLKTLRSKPKDSRIYNPN